VATFAGGGPVLINLIHEIDLLRFVCGEISSVQAIAPNAVRGFAVEDTTATILRFDDGAIATIMLSDAAVSPWSWDLTSGENPAFFNPKADTHFICGTEGDSTSGAIRVPKDGSSRLRGTLSRLRRLIPTRNRCGTSRPLFAPRRNPS
jgi:predicted secreted protein